MLSLTGKGLHGIHDSLCMKHIGTLRGSLEWGG